MIGPVGGKLHTGRSRNDQVATDMHLYLRKRVVEFVGLADKLQEALLEQAKANLDTISQAIRICSVRSRFCSRII